MDAGIDLVLDFFAQARGVAIGHQLRFDATTHDLLAIAEHPTGRAEFKRQLGALNDPELREQIVDFVLDLADDAGKKADASNRGVDLVDRAGLGTAGSVTVAGIGMLVAKGAAAGSLFGATGLLFGGLIGVIASAAGRHTLKRRSDDSKSAGQKLRRLVGK